MGSKGLPLLLALCALLVQLGTATHALAYGEEPHSHDGVECLLAHAGDRQDDHIIPPSCKAIVRLPLSETIVEAHAEAALLIPTVTESPPGRAPPLS